MRTGAQNSQMDQPHLARMDVAEAPLIKSDYIKVTSEHECLSENYFLLRGHFSLPVRAHVSTQDLICGAVICKGLFCSPPSWTEQDNVTLLPVYLVNQNRH